MALPNLIYTDGQAFSLWRDGKLVHRVTELDGDIEESGARLAPAPGLVPLFEEFFWWELLAAGKLHNDRYVPLHPDLVELLTAWIADHHDRIRHQRRLIPTPTGPLNRHRVARILDRVARVAGIGHVHPHQLRHTLATQAINRGMRLEAIAALLGHRSLRMTLVYARIADRTVADEYAAVSEQVDALYGHPQLPAEAEPRQMARLRQEAHARLLGNGLCTRPTQLDCRMDTVCETCTYFQTGPDFVPILIRQRDHAHDRNQTERAALFDHLIQQADQDTPLTPITRITPIPERLDRPGGASPSPELGLARWEPDRTGVASSAPSETIATRARRGMVAAQDTFAVRQRPGVELGCPSTLSGLEVGAGEVVAAYEDGGMINAEPLFLVRAGRLEEGDRPVEISRRAVALARLFRLMRVKMWSSPRARLHAARADSKRATARSIRPASW